MSTDVIAALLILTGSLIFLFTLRNNRFAFSIYKVIPRAKRKKFKNSLITLDVLILFFFLGYLLLAYLLLIQTHNFSDLLVAIITFCGAIFTYISSRLNARMLESLSETIETLIPMCAWCKKIRVTNPQGPKWLNSDEYLEEKGVGEVTHGICPKCRESHKME